MMDTRICSTCGHAGLHHSTADVTREFRGLPITIPAVEGWHCTACGEVEFDSTEAATQFFQAAQSLQQDALRDQARHIRQWRKHLGLTQRQAGELFGGGVAAFSEYEHARTQPHKSTVLLLQLLAKHPELLGEIR